MAKLQKTSLFKTKSGWMVESSGNGIGVSGEVGIRTQE